MSVQDLIATINNYALEGKYFWMCGLAKEAYPILISHLEELNEYAQQAVEHYAETKGK